MNGILISYIWCLLIVSFFSSSTGFTCQGSSYSAALNNCPDNGVQKASIGGNVTFFVKYATNLPNRDLTGPSSKVSDPYVKFTAGGVSASSSVIRNNLNPVWNEYVSIGYVASGTLVRVEIWDADSGLEFSDDLLVYSTMRVPFCSTFYANYSTLDCGHPFGCSSDESLWAMPTRKLCNESGIISFVQGRLCSSAYGICLYLEVHIVPFTMEVELENRLSILRTPGLSAASPISADAPWTYDFGLPFLLDSSTKLNMAAIQASSLKGALMFRLYAKDKAYGKHDTVKFYAGVNFPAYIYVCRDSSDNSVGVPDWLTSEFNGRNKSIQELFIMYTDITFQCYFLESEGTVKNKYGGVMSGAIALKSNTIASADNDFVTDQSFYRHMYIVLSIPRLIVSPQEIITVIYDGSLFVNSIAKYGFVFAWFMFFIARFLKKIQYRIDRIPTYLVTRVLTGDEKSLLATLFMNYSQTPCNIEFRAHLYHASNVFYFILTLPIFFLFSWGFVCTATLRPVALGVGVFFLGSSAIFFWYGFKLWESSNWLLSPYSLLSLSLSILFFLIFIISVVFVDPAVLHYGHDINFPALSLFFGTLNCIPLFLLTFKQDRIYKANLKMVIEKMGNALSLARQQEGSKSLKKSDLKANKLLHALLGDKYTLNPNVPMFRFSTVLQELPNDDAAFVTSIGNTSISINQGNDLYNVSLVILLIYVMIAVARSGYPSLAFLNCLALILLDAIHTSLSHGDVDWSPGYKITLLVVGRMFIMGSGSTVWLLNYSVVFLVYSFALVREIINFYLPKLSARQASEMVFSLKEDLKDSNPDIAGSPYFCFGWLLFAFIGVIFVSAVGGVSSKLPNPPVAVFGAEWPVYVFGVIAIMVAITGGLLTATVRSFYLERHGLLKEWARKVYMFRPSINISLILAIFSEVAILTSGVVVYGMTGANVVVILAVFVPIIGMTMGYAFHVWVTNDYVLVHWPPRDDVNDKKNDNPSDLEVAFNMIENLFGEEGEGEEGPETDSPQEKTLKGFKLPTLEATGNKVETAIKMPPLPLKSVLRKKRQTLGIKVKQPLVKDLKAREGADVDKFGSGSDDIIDLNDPWAQYEVDDEAESKMKPKPKKAIGFRMENREGFMQHPYILSVKKFIDNSKSIQFLLKKFNACWTDFRKKSKKYTKISFFRGDDDGNDNEEGELDNENGDEEGNESGKKVPASENLASMPFYQAVLGGFLTPKEYKALFSFWTGLFFIFIMGIAIANNNSPAWLGNIIWVSIFMFILTFIPVVKYFNTFIFDQEMKNILKFTALFHFLFCICFFGVTLHSDIGIAASLWILDYFFYYPAFLYFCVEVYRWRDSNYALEILDKDGDGNITIAEYLEFFKAYPILLAMMIILVWQFYVWINYLFGEISTLMLLTVSIGYIFVRDWATNDFFLSPELSQVLDYMIKFTMFISFCVAIFRNVTPAFPLSVFFFTYIFKLSSSVVTRVMTADADTLVFFSPLVLPVYTYDPQTNDLVDESPVIKTSLIILILGAFWGATMATFLYPVNVGIAVACVFLLVIAAIVSIAMTYLPMQLGKYATLLTPDSMVDAASAATGKFVDRRQPLAMEIPDWDRDMAEVFVDKPKTPFEKLKEKTTISLVTELINDVRSLEYVRDDSDAIQAQTITVTDEDEFEPPWYQRYYTLFRQEMKKLFELIPNKNKGWKKHSESLFSFTDALAEALITGRGPYGFVGLEGQWYKLFKEAQKHPKLKFLQQPWLEVYDENGNDKSHVLLSEHLESLSILSRMPDMDAALNHAFKEEFRCSVHFLLMLIVAADAKMQREQVLFQKFLRENRFRLASNGISPPAEIFSSSSYASINIPLVAVWLASLTPEERERFQLLKGTFSDEQKDRDEAIDNADYQFLYDANTLKTERIAREKEYAEKMKKISIKRLNERVQQFAETLNPMDRAKFQLRRDVWVNNLDCFVDSRELELYEKFKAACFVETKDEYIELARQDMADLEAAQKDCRMGEYGRAYQFVDSEFPPSDASIGECPASSSVLGWRCAPGVSEGVQLFNGGTDPDDICEGVFEDTWILSALSMLAAAGGVGDGLVDEQILNLFIGHIAMDGEVTHHTEVGAYCVKLFKQGAWNPIIVDDLLPMRRKEYWNNENRGMACAHSKECNGLWVSIVEKAFAKFYGSYAHLERGYVHHALEDMTGCDAECMPLSYASRGVGKRALWDTLVRFQKNGYIIGAGTGASSLVDKEIQDMGIVFNAAYTIYDIRNIDGYRLIKLRNPPGDHDEWKGDWSDKSSLWTRRLKGKVGYVDANDNTFYMSFDDFCNVFRYLYVCKWYNHRRWGQTQFQGSWKKAAEEAVDEANVMRQMLMEENGIVDNAVVDKEAEERKRAKSRIDTSGGLPTKHNPACVIENNPQYSLKIFRPTEMRLTVTQVDARGKVTDVLVPFAVYIIKNAHESVPMRVKEINKDNVIAFSGHPKPERSVNLYVNLKPDLYVVLIAPYIAGMNGNFVVNLVHNYRNEFLPLWPPKWSLKGEKGKVPAEFGSVAGQSEESSVTKATNGFTKGIKKGIKTLFGVSVGDESDSSDDEDDETTKKEEIVPLQ